MINILKTYSFYTVKIPFASLFITLWFFSTHFQKAAGKKPLTKRGQLFSIEFLSGFVFSLVFVLSRVF